ncbi:cytochrome b5-related protein-like [Diorhabda carinulata]|uniref:cytochrome b5-related protein-like n=1 Tax=Diorhabda sublineata TaxID=1163346 RepID=UPI0024E1159C|nr:cytochrome b5-related protein-like [Diorhabda sublineata]XP_057664205.1 cytochrome b5-related protein-like [Diorhabda carinulata]XP_057664206.1 cytochrome b5-related protein-like [Diorhabda carinulata]XP_057664207.1 cytochrome b5-related protein-like [Diorhabda carinulata]XP_057664208.1 cytochrome b5-related protein-like [Diorhabda carinulata]
MAPKAEFIAASTLGIKSPETKLQGASLIPDLWLEGRTKIDGAEGLWRIHDGIYDLTDFVESHPGGSEWLKLTKGTDLTEAFEVHHLTELPEQILKKYFVKNAKTKRNSPFTFNENGFYRTLKKEIRPVLKNVPKQSMKNTNFICDAMVFLLFLFAILATLDWNYWLGNLAGIILGMLTIATHNYTHMKDNFRMYYFQFSMLQVRDWRITHVLSHHLYTNTIIDLEISMLKPIVQYLPVPKTLFQQVKSVLSMPFVYLTYFYGSIIRRIITARKCKYQNLKLTDLTGLSLPLIMYMFGGRSLWETLLMWSFILTVGGTFMAFIGLNGAHHHPDIFHDGDTPRNAEDYDWGLSQLDSVMEHKEVCGSHFLVLINFGDHCLHHLFPTLDHGVLEHLYPVFEDVLKRFDLNLRFVTKWDTLLGSYQQLTRIEPNPNPPDLKKYPGRPL